MVAPTAESAAEDRLIGVEEASRRLAIAASTLYKKADEYPFTVRQLAGRVQGEFVRELARGRVGVL